MEHGLSYHLTAIAGHLREAGADYKGVVISLPEGEWIKLASRLVHETSYEITRVGRKANGPREFTFHGIRYRSLG